MSETTTTRPVPAPLAVLRSYVAAQPASAYLVNVPAVSLVKGYVDSASTIVASDLRTEVDRQVAQLRADLGYTTVDYRRPVDMVKRTATLRRRSGDLVISYPLFLVHREMTDEEQTGIDRARRAVRWMAGGLIDTRKV